MIDFDIFYFMLKLEICWSNVCNYEGRSPDFVTFELSWSLDRLGRNVFYFAAQEINTQSSHKCWMIICSN